MKILILAGGGGTRLWPLSRQDFPKQFIRFNEPFSLLQKTVKRFLSAPFSQEITVLTNLQYQALVEEQLKKIDPEKKVHILIEPVRKNTAPAIALGVKFLQEFKNCSKDETILVIPSDHLLEPESVFLNYLQKIESLNANEKLILFGIKPSKPETGYGYIQVGAQENELLFKVLRFVEKPSLEKAIKYLLSKDFYWNAGMFAFTLETFWNELKTHAPAISFHMQGSFKDALEHFSKNPDISIDYALLEKTKKAAVCPLPVNWSDIGSWDSVYEVMDKDENLNVKIGNVLDIETKNSLIMGNKKLISTIGLEDLLIVDTDEAMFIGKKGESQKVKALVDALKETKKGTSLEVKQLYTSEQTKLLLLKIPPKQSFSYKKQGNGLAKWVHLSGKVKVDKQVLDEKTPNFSNNFSEILIKNLSDSFSEVLLIQNFF